MPHRAHGCHCDDDQPPAEPSLLPFILLFFAVVFLYLKWKGWL